MISIELDSQTKTFQPGDKISGTVTWEDLTETKLETRLIWYTQGKGDRDVGFIDVHRVESPPPSGKARFDFTAPNRPYSYSGKLTSLIWAVEALTFPNKIAEQAKLTISPGGNEIVLTPLPKDKRTFKDQLIRLRRR